MTRAADDATKVGFFYGAGLMGVIAGSGLIGKEGNRSALLLGIAALVYAHQLKPILDVAKRAEFDSTIPSLPSAPRLPWQAVEPESAVTFQWGR